MWIENLTLDHYRSPAFLSFAAFLERQRCLYSLHSVRTTHEASCYLSTVSAKEPE